MYLLQMFHTASGFVSLSSEIVTIPIITSLSIFIFNILCSFFFQLIVFHSFFFIWKYLLCFCLYDVYQLIKQAALASSSQTLQATFTYVRGFEV